jgi:osmotically inducible lipoprotein OsmB
MINQSLKVTVVVAGLALLTAACGDRPVDRALTGGAIGAGSGAVIGSTVGNPIAGAVIGGELRASLMTSSMRRHLHGLSPQDDGNSVYCDGEPER